MTFLQVLDIILFLTMAMFSGWNWFLALQGYTTIEFLKTQEVLLTKDPNVTKAKVTLPTMSDNLYRVFGTYKLFRVLSPSFRNVPFTGLEWSFRFKDEGFDCEGLSKEEVDAEAQARKQAVNQFLEEEEDEVEMI